LAHTRTFLLNSPDAEIEIIDEIEGVQNVDSIEWYFHLAPGLKAELLANRVAIRKDDNLICQLEHPARMSTRIERFDHSPSYGCLQKAITLIITRRVEDSDSPHGIRFSISFGETI
jgi:hypothetical protein